MYHCVILLELNPDQVKELDLNSVRNITMQDFRDSLKRIRRSVSPASLAAYEKWSFEYGDVSLWFMMNCFELPNNRVRMKCNWRYGIANVLEYRRTVMSNVDTNSNTFCVFTPYYWTILIFIKEKKSSERVKGGKKYFYLGLVRIDRLVSQSRNVVYSCLSLLFLHYEWSLCQT